METQNKQVVSQHSGERVTETQKNKIERINRIFENRGYKGEIANAFHIAGSFKAVDNIRVIVDLTERTVEIGCSAEILDVDTAQTFSLYYSEAVLIARDIKSIVEEVE